MLKAEVISYVVSTDCYQTNFMSIEQFKIIGAYVSFLAWAACTGLVVAYSIFM